MVTVMDDKVLFSRDRVVTSTQASKNFGEAKERARDEPLFVSDRNAGIDFVIVSFDEFEKMAVELDSLRREKLYAKAAERVAAADNDTGHEAIPLSDVMDGEEYEEFLATDSDDVPDEELFE